MEMKEWDLPGAEELSPEEKNEIQGGGLLSSLGVWGAIAASFINNFGDFRNGVSDGANKIPPRY
jgi:hypothetical protein